MFGLNKKSNLIRSLLEKRLSMRKQLNPDNINFINSLVSMKLNSLPEGIIVTVLDTVEKVGRQGGSIYDAIGRLEKLRGMISSNRSLFQTIHELSRTHPNGALIEYISYRIEIESNFRESFSSYEITQLISVAKPIIARW